MFFLVSGGVATAATLAGLGAGVGAGLALAAAYHGRQVMNGQGGRGRK